MSFAYVSSTFARELTDHAAKGYDSRKIDSYDLPKIDDHGVYVNWYPALIRALRGARIEEVVLNLIEDPEYYEWYNGPTKAAKKKRDEEENKEQALKAAAASLVINSPIDYTYIESLM